ncbi:hypothetical protein USB125703_01903 [Pseudoclavibacter triregionum]|nr:hypothetical protein USB125703_01903 [Pseudoclavibacter triregionum]
MPDPDEREEPAAPSGAAAASEAPSSEAPAAEAPTVEDPAAEADGPRFSEGRTLVVALRGWNDAGDAASEAALLVRRRLAASSETLWTCDDEDFFDYSLHRPLVQNASGGERRIIWPSVTVTGPAADAELEDAPQLADDAELRVSGENRGVYVLMGVEPTLRWKSFAKRVMEFVDEHGITRIVLVGALLADTPHTRPIPIYASSDHPEVRRELEVSRSEYEGPTGMLGILSSEARRRGDVLALSLWASVPHYAHASPSPKATSALVDRLEEVLDLSIPHADLLEEAAAWEAEVDEMASGDEDIAEYVAHLERTYDMVEAPEASGEAIAREFERFLEQAGSSSASKGLQRGPRRPRADRPQAGLEQPDADRPDADRPDDAPGTPEHED